MKKNLGGRPKKRRNDCKMDRYELRLGRGEKTKLRSDAKAAGKTLANWIRSRLGLQETEYGK